MSHNSLSLLTEEAAEWTVLLSGYKHAKIALKHKFRWYTIEKGASSTPLVPEKFLIHTYGT